MLLFRALPGCLLSLLASIAYASSQESSGILPGSYIVEFAANSVNMAPPRI
jgi:hypothetical protein